MNSPSLLIPATVFPAPENGPCNRRVLASHQRPKSGPNTSPRSFGNGNDFPDSSDQRLLGQRIEVLTCLSYHAGAGARGAREPRGSVVGEGGKSRRIVLHFPASGGKLGFLWGDVRSE